MCNEYSLRCFKVQNLPVQTRPALWTNKRPERELEQVDPGRGKKRRRDGYGKKNVMKNLCQTRSILGHKKLLRYIIPFMFISRSSPDNKKILNHMEFISIDKTKIVSVKSVGIT